ncbi:MAG: hypothetical protein KY469_02660 [Actinobacteria bacterium]|nr:hypothetical protein [Actinomycetota bacterium]
MGRRLAEPNSIVISERWEDVAGVGAPGSTGPWFHLGHAGPASAWLRHVLIRRHPQLRLFPQANRLAPTLLRRIPGEREFDPDHPAWQSLVRAARPVMGKVSVASFDGFTALGEATRSSLERSLRRLGSLFPEARILFVVREQVAAVATAYAEHLDAGGQGSARRFVSELCQEGASDVLHHDATIELLRDVFGDDRVEVLLDEDCLVDPEAWAARCYSSLGVQSDAPWLVDLERPSLCARSRSTVILQRALNRAFGPSTSDPRTVTPRWPGWVRSLPVPRAGPVDEDPRVRWETPIASMPSSLARDLGRRYVQSNRRAEQMTGYDLSGAGYAVTS